MSDDLSVIRKRADFLAAKLSRPLAVWLKLDSGMHRLGFDARALHHVDSGRWHVPPGETGTARAEAEVVLTPEAAVTLLTSRIGGATSIELRRLRQSLRREEILGGGGRTSDALLVEALLEPNALSSLGIEGRAAPVEDFPAGLQGGFQARFQLSFFFRWNSRRVGADRGRRVRQLPPDPDRRVALDGRGRHLLRQCPDGVVLEPGAGRTAGPAAARRPSHPDRSGRGSCR